MSIVLKELMKWSSVSLSIMLIGKLFQSMMVQGKKHSFGNYVVDEDGGI